MKISKILLAAALGTSGLCASHLLAPSTARAQSTTTGAIQGVVTDKKTGEPMAGVTVVATSTALGQTQSAFTDDKGLYKIVDLPPGDYKVTFYFADITVEQDNVHVGINKTTGAYQKIDQSAAGGETIKVEAKAPLIDVTSTTQGITIDKNYLNNIPVPGRTFESALTAAAGSSSDALGVSFSGATSLENQYVVDGINTTGLTYGTIGSPVVNDFIEEIEVLTGGYNAEFGRATGGVVQVVTKSGSNDFKGSVWGFWQPGLLTAAAKVTPINASSIDAIGNVAYDADFGFEIGGPIIKDKLWYFVGFDPMFHQTDFTRFTRRETDCRATADPANGRPQGPIPGLTACDRMYADGVPDIDPKTGFYITDTVDTEIRSEQNTTYNLLGKLNYALTPEHQGQVSFQILPGNLTQPGIFGPAVSGGGYKASQLTSDVSGKWTSKFNDNKTEVEAVIGWHRDYFTSDALDPSYEQQPFQALVNGNLGVWGPGFGESPQTNAGCFDDPNPQSTRDPYPLITNCPITSPRAYYIGGIGSINRDTEERIQAKVGITERLKAAGTHEIKAGIDGENNTSNKARLYSGGGYITNFLGSPGEVFVDRYVQLAGMTSADNPDPNFFNQTCTTPDPFGINKNESFNCAYLSGVPGSRGTQIVGHTLDWAAYLRDSWQIQPNLTLNYGVRYEDQTMRYASFLQNTVDPLTGEKLGENAMHLDNNWAPRIGIMYDWTKEGRSKIYANYGRYFENIPMDINDRSFGGEVTYEQRYTANTGNCGPVDPNVGAVNGVGCLNGTKPGDLGQNLIGASGELIAPGIKAEYLDEYIAGAEYEILDDLKIGINFNHRSFGRIIEDVSTDGANTYVIANPGEWSSSDESAFMDRINRTDDPVEKARLQHELTLFQGIRTFDTGRRDYNALQFTLTRRFSKNLYVQGSYTYSRVEGNYPGSFSPDNGQIDPNISSQFDLIELLANRIGPLPQDRPHYIKLDGYYTFDWGNKGAFTIGTRVRARSGVPENALGAHYLYGPDESFLLPRGELGRSDFDHGVDARFIYSRNLPKGMRLEIIADIFNIYDRQGTADVDNTYAPPVRLSCIPAPGVNCASTSGGTPQNANPISGGTYDDLIWLKTIDQNGVETSTPIGRNPNFHNTIARYAPASARLGVRLTF